jgi:hypothetical protein
MDWHIINRPVGEWSYVPIAVAKILGLCTKQRCSIHPGWQRYADAPAAAILHVLTF